MKPTKILALGLMTISLTSCLGDDEDKNSTYTYTDYLDINASGTKCTTDDGNTYDITNSSLVSEKIPLLTDLRAMVQFSVEYDPSGNMVGGFTFQSMGNCYVKDCILQSEMPTIAKDGILGVTTTYCSINNKYMNLFITANEPNGSAKALDKEKIYMYISGIQANTVYVKLAYANDDSSSSSTVVNEISQPVSFNLKDALYAIRDQITPLEGKIQIILANNNSVYGNIDWKY